MIEGPASLYSAFEIHICWNVDSNDRIDPPIQTEYLRSGGATTLTSALPEQTRAVFAEVPSDELPSERTHCTG
ncbi:hypothetical protein PC129_g14476 [Phytophthora cactorum]|uniref:Uncharacterized protein n=1 Tax=Phytophthora cactorum TaxID=29920 RepID=A0A8T1BKU4_9STRA|nr:hypothetical protein Pcac1_g4943 [Phytophthora cactorum]KAG2810258.1 hypothetical protein PC112_g16130 [Phytophthora cactorum]KAG2811724.1 hypothetical protein PC111_g15113 [Phytophthora cactorum]KAG2851089.1 hypothetical protein PC113_g16206 [Phytophthora cactorum]KAG2889874.1 hypothetical protein PC114_g17735 [Phytophthora cactorum]